MALGVLGVFNLLIVMGVLIAQFFLYKDQSNMKFFVINMLLGILISFLAFTALPSNYTGQRLLTLVFGALAVVAYFVHSKSENKLLSKLLLSVSIIGNIIQLFM